MSDGAREFMKKMRAANYSPPDGVLRAPEDERALNVATSMAFGTFDGKTVLAWLHQITTLRNLADTASEQELRALNAQRNLVAIIVERIEHGRHGRPDVSTSGK